MSLLTSFMDAPIKRKLMLISLLTSGFALLYITLTLAVTGWVDKRAQAVSDLTTYAHMIGANATSAMLFNDEDAATKTLAALAANPDIVDAVIYDKEGKMFARYLAPQHASGASHPTIEPGSHLFNTHRLLLAEPIQFKDKVLGSIYLEFDLRHLYVDIQSGTGLTFIIVLSAFLASLFLFARLQKTIVAPIQELANGMQAVSTDQNYALRVAVHGKDEVGRLAGAFNDMLESIQQRTAALEHAKLELEQASRGKDEFLAAISHELKTPLNHILGFADLLKEGLAGELNAEQKDMAQDIFDAGSKQLAIVNSLIELARLQAGKVELRAEPQDPAQMLGEIAARHAAKAQASGLAFAVEVAQGLGEMPLDREVVTHLLDQLLENAFKFTPSGGKVSLTARRVPRTDVAAPVRSEAGEYLELAVVDNGPGIAPEILHRLFQPFVQGDGRLARSHGGTGVGLTLVRLLAELHGGGSGVESKLGIGTKFMVWLPCGAADVGAASPPSQPSPAGGGKE